MSNILLFLLAGIRTLFNIAYRMFYPFLGVFARAVGVPIEELAWAMSARSLIGASAAPFLSHLADRKGRRLSMGLGLGLFIISMAIVVISPNFTVLAIAVILGTTAKYIFDPATQAYLGDRIAYEQRGLALAILEAGWSLSFFVGIPVVGFLVARSGWTAPFAWMAALGAGLLVLLLKMIPPDKPEIPSAKRWDGFQAVFASRIALIGLCTSFLANTANEIINLNFGVWLENNFALQIAALGFTSLLIGIAEFAGEGGVALLADRLGKKRAMMLGLSGNVIATFLFLWGGRSVGLAMLELTIFYFTFEFALVASIPLMTELLPQARATMMAFNVTALSLGRAAGAPLSAYLYEHGFQANVWGAILFNLLALWTLRKIPKR